MADTTITIPSGSALDERLERVSRETGHSKSDVALEALLDWRDEQEDISEVLSRSARNEPTHSIEEVRRQLGLED